jgi:hypothetical protein
MASKIRALAKNAAILYRRAILAEASCSIYLVPLAEANGNERSRIFKMASIEQWA